MSYPRGSFPTLVSSGARAIRRVRLPESVSVMGAALLLAFLAVWAGPQLGGGVPRGDSFTFFIPMFSFLGDRLRAFDVPGWNPHILSGAPFAGDPESGWMYLPAMLFFAILPSVSALTGYAIFHLVLAGTSAYVLGRLLGLGVAGAAVAGLAYQFSPFVEGAECCSIRTHVASWLPLALIGVELALSSSGWLRRIASWGLAGLAIFQMLSGWIGQGAYYGLVAVGAFTFFRAVISPPIQHQNLRARLSALMATGIAILVVGFGLAAAGVLPRIDATSRSNLAGGVYHGTAAEKAATGGWHPLIALDRIMSADDAQPRWYIGAAVFSLAIVGPFIARQRAIAFFFAALSASSVLLTLDPTPLHRLLYLLPQFQVLHEHVPNRVLVVFFIGSALLAGMTVDAIARPTIHTRRLSSVVLLPPLIVSMSSAVLVSRDQAIGTETIVGVFATSLILAIAALLGRAESSTPRLSRLATTVVVPAVLAFLVFWDPAGHDILGVVRDGAMVPRVPRELRSLPCLDRQNATAIHLQRQGEHELFRFFGYDPLLLQSQDGLRNDYRGHLREKPVQHLLVGNQSICLGLDDIQGYNPVQSMRYVEYIAALNGGEQEYHDTAVLPTGLTSPLLDALNARFMVVPADATLQDDPLRQYPTVYRNRNVRVLGRPSALPRAWLVHEAQQMAYGEALSPLANGSIDPRRTALLETEPPPLAMPIGPEGETVTIARYEPDRIDLQVTAEANALLVLSEVWDPGWNATLNGASVPVLVANHALRAVPVPQGQHTVVLRYDPLSLRLGLVTTAVTAILLVGTIAFLGWRAAARHTLNEHESL